MMALQLLALFCFMTAFQICFVDAFRSDYTFIESTHSYYKLYKERTTWPDAKSKCESEDAVLFHPDNKAEILQVFSALAIGNNGGNSWIDTGISNLRDVDVFETVDGRPVNQVYNTWRSGEPRSKAAFKCTFLEVHEHILVTDPCTTTSFPYICKHSKVIVDTDVKIIANASLKIADLERTILNQSAALVVLEQLTKNQTAELKVLEQLTKKQIAELEVLEQLTKNQTAELEDLDQLTTNKTAELKVLEQVTANQTAELEALKRQQQQYANQPSLLEFLVKAIANQTLAIQQLADANQIVALERLTVNQVAAMQQVKETTRMQLATQPSVLAIDRQAVDMDRQAAVMDRQAAAMDRQASAMDRQVAAMDRQARLLEKLVLLLSNTEQLHDRSEQ